MPFILILSPCLPWHYFLLPRSASMLVADMWSLGVHSSLLSPMAHSMPYQDQPVMVLEFRVGTL